jgi:DNA-binding SARP family transcriptional activator
LVEADWIQLNPITTLWLDVAIFEQAYELTQGIPGYALNTQQKQALQLAIPLYQGDLLEGWYQQWCLFERERLQNMYLEMLNKLMDACEAVQEYEAGLIYGTRILRCDRAHEPTHRRLMRLHYLTGNRTAALRQYRRCLAALKEELDVRPGKSTVALYEQIRTDRLSELTPVLPKTDVPSISLLDILEHLHHLHSELTTIQQQLQQDIQAVEVIMKAKQ